MATSAFTRLFGVIGHPVGHSLSPAMHSAAIEALGLDAVYLAFEVPPERVAGALEGMRAMGLRGLNVTIPHKAAVMSLVDDVDDAARRAQGVNTVTNDGGRLLGSSTDGPGFMRSLVEAGVEARGSEVLLVGSGGAARAIAATLATEAKGILVAARNPDARSELVRAVRELGGVAEAMDLTESSLCAGLQTCRMLINCTPLGMWPRTEACIPVRSEDMTADHVVVDIVPNPTETMLLRRAAERGAKIVDGLAMLVHQGAISLEIWTGETAPVQAMRAAAEAALEARRAAR